ncbi:ceramidase domain-containing protein [Pseudopelagicola sp. nBUS_20]|uniref:ceramidase domain-containing protein n=1 Tax=Pseudopelagicola sp. nBUS_20 TaxID=3395317 RepID=UPI003EBA46C6
MDWLQRVNGYCERLGPEYWAEPVNALTNFAFVIAAFIMWRRLKGPDLGLAKMLCVVLAMIGLGSYLLHTHAQIWAGLADVLPIIFFIALYIFAANLGFWRMPWWSALGLTLMFFPYAALTAPIFQKIFFIGDSAAYWPVALLIATYAILLRRRLPEIAWRLGIGAGVLVVSLILRSLDDILCPTLPVGTHFLWHLLNSIMLGWMIEIYRLHVFTNRKAE